MGSLSTNPEKQPDGKTFVALYPRASSGNAYLQQLRGLLASDSSIEVFEPSSEKEIKDRIQAARSGLMIFYVRDKGDLLLVLNAMSTLQTSIKSRALRVIGVNQIEHSQVAPMLMKRGCADVFSASLHSKALQHKINQALKIVRTYSAGRERAQQQARAASNSQAVPQAIQAQRMLKKVPALNFVSDCWLVRKDRDLRRVQGRWIVELIGPGPSSGTWEEKAHDTWEWKPKALADGSIGEKAFVSDEGAWIYVGRKPEFIWDQSRWRFLGDRMSLSFMKGESLIACRFRLTDGALEYAENSSYARQKLPAIVKSVENEVRFRNGKKAKAADSKIADERDSAVPIDREFESEAAAEGRVFDFEVAEEPEQSSGDYVEEQETRESDGATPFEEELDANPYTQAPQPKLKIWAAPAKPRDGEKYRPVEATPVELSETSLLLEVPRGAFERGEDLILVMDDGLMKPGSKSQVKAAVTTVESGEETDVVALKVDAEMVTTLVPIQKAFEERQEEIVNFLKAARGW